MYRQCEHGFVGAHGFYGTPNHARRCSKDGCSDMWFDDELDDAINSGPIVCHIHENGTHYTRIVKCVICDRYSEWIKSRHRVFDRAKLEHVCRACATDGPFSLLASPRCVCCGAASALVDAHPWHVSQSRAEELERLDKETKLYNGVCSACIYRNFLCPLSLTWSKRTEDARRADLEDRFGRSRAPKFRFLGDDGDTIRSYWPNGAEWQKKRVAATLADFWVGGDIVSMKAMAVALLVAAEARKAAKALAA
jgi:hypothetical protein